MSSAMTDCHGSFSPCRKRRDGEPWWEEPERPGIFVQDFQQIKVASMPIPMILTTAIIMVIEESLKAFIE